jgi:hypothetical protein
MRRFDFRPTLLCLSLLLTASPVAAQDGLGLAAPPEVVDSGLLGFILPRFSLKTGVRVTPDADGTLVIADAPPGTPVFRRGDQTYFLRGGDSSDAAARFADWLTSDIGLRTVESFAPDSPPPFSAPVEDIAEAEPVTFEGDSDIGGTLSLRHCGRCHVIDQRNRMAGLGSAPSFGVLRGLPDWDVRFQQFFVLAPHMAFTQIADVTEPFPIDRPPPIVPVEMTWDEMEAILAFVSAMPATDLGAPLQFQ